MKHIIFISIFFFLAPLFLVHSQNLKIGFVDSQKIFEKLPEAQQAKKKLDSLAKIWQDEMEKMIQGFQAQYEDYKSNQGTVTDVGKKAKEQDLMKLQKQIQDFRVQKFGQTGDLAHAQKKILEPIQKKIKIIIDSLQIEEGF